MNISIHDFGAKILFSKTFVQGGWQCDLVIELLTTLYEAQDSVFSIEK